MTQEQADWYERQLPADVRHWLKFEAAVNVSVKQVYEVWLEHGPKTRAILMVTQCRDCEDLYDPSHPDSFTATRERLLEARRQALAGVIKVG